MGRGGHGGAFSGGAHSHDPNNPDDTWNIYQHIEHATALNATDPEQALGVFKPHVRRCDPTPVVTSDGDPELLVKVKFATPVHIRRLMVIGGNAHGAPPRRVKVGSHAFEKEPPPPSRKFAAFGDAILLCSVI